MYPRKQVTHCVTHWNYLVTHALFQFQTGLAVSSVGSLNALLLTECKNCSFLWLNYSESTFKEICLQLIWGWLFTITSTVAETIKSKYPDASFIRLCLWIHGGSWFWLTDPCSVWSYGHFPWIRYCFNLLEERANAVRWEDCISEFV